MKWCYYHSLICSDSRVFDVERTAIQTVESPTRHEIISEIHNFSVRPIVEIDLTQDDNDNEGIENFVFF